MTGQWKKFVLCALVVFVTVRLVFRMASRFLLFLSMSINLSIFHIA
jgi:hypothetical protein